MRSEEDEEERGTVAGTEELNGCGRDFRLSSFFLGDNDNASSSTCGFLSADLRPRETRGAGGVCEDSGAPETEFVGRSLSLDIQIHNSCRNMMPNNTIPAIRSSSPRPSSPISFVGGDSLPT